MFNPSPLFLFKASQGSILHVNGFGLRSSLVAALLLVFLLLAACSGDSGGGSAVVDEGVPGAVAESPGADDTDPIPDGLTPAPVGSFKPLSELAEERRPLDPVAQESLGETVEFLYSGPDPVQLSVASGAISVERSALITGHLVDREGQPVSGVRVAVKGAAHYGYTYSRDDGQFALVVNEGQYRLYFTRSGYLEAERTTRVRPGDSTELSRVTLLTLDPVVTDIAPGSDRIQVAQGSVSEDASGSRQATVVFPPATNATMVMADGSTRALEEPLQVRATEFTVGENGPSAMPGELPPTSAYTYAVELSVDEAILEGAARVDFNQPLPLYVDNFIGFPVGTVVPAGWFDREQGGWVPRPNGVVMAILGEQDDMALVDTTGDGAHDDAERLALLGITDEERGLLAQLYSAGDSLWRTPVEHFSPWDLNWPLSNQDQPPPPEPEEENVPPEPEDVDPDCVVGSIIECQTGTLRQSIPITGTDLQLHYRSDRHPGRSRAIELTFPAATTGRPVDAGRAVARVDVAGRSFDIEFAPHEQVKMFNWDGKDALGREVAHEVTATIRYGYEYPIQYRIPRGAPEGAPQFAAPGISPANVSDGQVTTFTVAGRNALRFGSERYQVIPSASPSHATSVGGWTLSSVHRYDAKSQQVLPGDGSAPRAAAALQGEYEMESFKVSEESMFGVKPTMDTDGSLYWVGVPEAEWNTGDMDPYHVISRVSPNGSHEYFAGSGARCLIFSDSEQEDACYWGAQPVPAASVAIDPQYDLFTDGVGNVYFADGTRLSRIDSRGRLRVLTGETGELPEGWQDMPDLKAVDYRLNAYYGAAAPDGSVIFYEGDLNKILRIDQNGYLHHYAGTGQGSGSAGWWSDFDLDSRESISAWDLDLPWVEGVELDDSGNLYFSGWSSGFKVAVMTPDGQVHPVFSSTEYNRGCDLSRSTVMDGVQLTCQSWQGTYSIYTLESSGRISTGITANEERHPKVGFFGGPYNGAAMLSSTEWLVSAAHPDYGFEEIVRIRRLGDWGDPHGYVRVASQTGDQVYLFDDRGRHRETRDRLSDELMVQMDYDDNGRLVSLTNAHGRTVTIERDASGSPTGVRNHFGQLTQLSLNADGLISSVLGPLGQTHHVEYGEGQLLTGMVYPGGRRADYVYEKGWIVQNSDSSGRSRSYDYILDMDDGGRRSVVTTDSLGLVTTRDYTRTEEGKLLQRTVYPEGIEFTVLTESDSHKIATAFDGTRVELLEELSEVDPSRVSSFSRVTTPPSGERVHTVQMEESVTWIDPQDITEGVASVTRVTRVNGRESSVIVDVPNHRVIATDEVGREARIEMSPQGLLLRQERSGLASVSREYNDQSQLTAILREGDGTVRRWDHDYDTRGRRSQTTAPNGAQWRFDYDDLGRLLREERPVGGDIRYEYNPANELTAVTMPGGARYEYAFDDAGRLTEERWPALDGQVAVRMSTYSSEGHLLSIAEPSGDTVNYTYSDVYLLERVTQGPFGQIDFEYAPESKRLVGHTTNEGEQVTLTFDGSVITDAVLAWPGGGSAAWALSYDDNNWLQSSCLEIQNTDYCRSFDYDDAGRMTQAEGMSLSYHEHSGLLTGAEVGNSQVDLLYNAFGEITRIEHQTGSEDGAIELTRSVQTGRVLSRLNSLSGIPGSQQVDYDYDTSGRLLSAKVGVTETHWQYDQRGNLTHENGAQIAFYDMRDRLLQYRDITFDYDANGTRTARHQEDETTTYQYDLFSNLRTVTLSDGTVITYGVDGRNRRVARHVNGDLDYRLIYGDQLNPVAMIDAGGVVTQFVYAVEPYSPSHMIRGGTTYQFVNDHLGSPQMIVNTETGEVAQWLRYDAWGQVVDAFNPDFQPFGFAGGLRDPDTGLIRFGARDYDPEVRRWTTPDPIGLAGGPNVYVYARNNPTNRIDPTGLSCIDPALDNLGMTQDHPEEILLAGKLTDGMGRKTVEVCLTVVCTIIPATNPEAAARIPEAPTGQGVVGRVVQNQGDENKSNPPESKPEAEGGPGPDPKDNGNSKAFNPLGALVGGALGVGAAAIEFYYRLNPRSP